MIYAGNKNDLDEIFKALSNCGIDDSAIEIGMEYLDMSKTADVSQLREIKMQTIKRPEINGSIYDFERQVRKHILKSPELIRRYAQFCYAVAGCNCLRLFDDMVNDKNVVLVKEAFAEMCTETDKKGIMAEAMFCAVKFDRAFNCYGYGTYSTINNMSREKQSPAVYLSASIIALPVNPKASLTMCILALDSLTTKDDTAIACISMIKDIIKQNISSLDDGMYKAALAECAYFDDEAKVMFRKAMENFPENLITFAYEINISFKRICQIVTDENIKITVRYISTIMEYSLKGRKQLALTEHLKYLAVNYSNLYVTAMRKTEDATVALKLLKILQEANPEYKDNDCKLKEVARKRLIDDIYTRSGKSQEIYDYITGKKSFEEIRDIIPKINFSIYGYGSGSSYCEACGADDTVKRCVIAFLLCAKSTYAKFYVENVTGFNDRKNNKEFAEMFFSENIPVNLILEQDIEPENLVPYIEKVADADISGVSVEGRICYLETLNLAGADKYKSKIFAMADDKSKAVKNLLVEVISKMNDCTDEVENMLMSKKSAVRSTALEIIEKMPDTDWSEVLTNVLEKEKSEKLKTKISALLGNTPVSAENKSVSEEMLINDLTKGSKAKKVEWLYQSQYRPVRLIDGGEASEKYMKALLLCYADNDFKIGKNLAEKLDTKDLEVYACEVMGRWLDKGAEAKNKWILTFASLHGGSEIISTFVYYIKFWSENMRGAMAVTAVKALALNGSSEALMQIDNMSRKYKSNQVKTAANEALLEAAEFLGITPEELADKIVPDMGFNEKMCRTFDYGSRKFSVYLTPALEIEIFNGDKKIKNLPKPSANDTAEIAEKSYVEFKEMKKQLKTAVSVQKERLEYSLMCERKWTAENWEKLFVKNPIMHCFAVGLIWGVYENNKLVSSFRYLDDGSFTTSDEDEFELPENAEISLVHPVELSDDELSAWTEQLTDYEITQPFAQLSRTVYRPESDELKSNEVKRFDNIDIMNQTLVGRMQKNGWTKGMAYDAGFFYEFYHTDISRRVKTPDGNTVPEGYIAELTFSGTHIGVYQWEAEEVTIENLCFYEAAHSTKKIPVNQVSERYFSEIIMQLMGILG